MAIIMGGASILSIQRWEWHLCILSISVVCLKVCIFIAMPIPVFSLHLVFHLLLFSLATPPWSWYSFSLVPTIRLFQERCIRDKPVRFENLGKRRYRCDPTCHIVLQVSRFYVWYLQQTAALSSVYISLLLIFRFPVFEYNVFIDNIHTLLFLYSASIILFVVYIGYIIGIRQTPANFSVLLIYLAVTFISSNIITLQILFCW